MEASVGAATCPPAGPAPPDRRIESIDVLRGVAVLGILAINIFAFGLPPMAYIQPLSSGGFQGLDRAAWWTTFLLFNYKMMPIFSMLFGAGLVLMAARFRGTGMPLRVFWYRRMLWLMLIGLLHGYLLWVGDILFLYAFCGMVVYLLRERRPRTLVAVALLFYAISIVPVMGTGFWFGAIRDRMPAIERKLEEGKELTRSEEKSREQWNEVRKMFEPTADERQEIVDTYRGGYAGIVRFRAPLYLANTTVMMLFGSFWPTAALMMIGMALMKTGVFSARRSRRFYLVQAVVGYGAGIPLAWLCARGMIGHGFSFVEVFRSDMIWNHLGGPLVALGHVALVMLFVSWGGAGMFRRALASAGRMAFSNYLSQSALCTTFFFGYGLGFFNSFDTAELMIVVAALWGIQLVISPLWLARFRYGPAEWLWRSLTYQRRQPMRRFSGNPV